MATAVCFCHMYHSVCHMKFFCEMCGQKKQQNKQKKKTQNTQNKSKKETTTTDQYYELIH